VAPAVLLREGRRWRVVGEGTDGPSAPVSTYRDVPAGAELLKLAERAPRALAGDPVVAAAWHAVGTDREVAELPLLLRLRRTLGAESSRALRERLLATATDDLARALASPEETTIALAREEERVERERVREAGAADSWLAPPEGPLADYSVDWASYRVELDRHHAALVRRTEDAARRLLPNLSRVVGARVAARLLATAGGTAALARMPASRLQLLGARRRPGRGRGPRHGVLYRAEGLDRVPPDRQGAYARSLAALAVIAARADVTTHRDLGAELVRRRDRRRLQLERRRG
jgi:hypothetical protein